MGIIRPFYVSNGLNLLHPRKDVAEMVIVFCVSLILPEDLMFAKQSGEHVYQESSFFVSPLSFLSFMMVSSINIGIVINHYKNPEITIMESTKFLFRGSIGGLY